MNTKLNKKRKPRECSIPDNYITELADELEKKYMVFSEVINFVAARTHKNYTIESILCILEARGYLVTQERQKVPHGYKTFYGIMTKEKYEKIAEEHRENAKRRLLAAISY